MISKIYVAIFFAGLMMAARCEGQTELTKIEFTSMTRGYQKQMFVDKDSLIVVVDGRAENEVIKRKMPRESWDAIQKEVAKVDLAKVSEYKSPSNRRAFDGAKHSTLKFTAANGVEVSHGFDDLEPHPDLKPVLDLLLNAENAERP